MNESKNETLRAGRAFFIFIVFNCVFILVTFLSDWLILTFFTSINPDFIDKALNNSLAIAIAIGKFFAGIVMILLSVKLIRPQLFDTEPNGAAWVLGSRSRIIKGVFFGVLIASFISILITFFPQTGEIKKEAFTRFHIFTSGNIPFICGQFSAIFLAPPIEEMFYRGVLYGGFRRSFGPIWGACIPTVLFIATHFASNLNYKNLLGISLLSVACLWMRIKSHAIGPSIALHFSYNTFLSVGATLCYLKL